MKPFSTHPHSPWKSLRDSHIPIATTTTEMNISPQTQPSYGIRILGARSYYLITNLELCECSRYHIALFEKISLRLAAEAIDGAIGGALRAPF